MNDCMRPRHKKALSTALKTGELRTIYEQRKKFENKIRNKLRMKIERRDPDLSSDEVNHIMNEVLKRVKWPKKLEAAHSDDQRY